jgi:hypothetical protein
LPSLNNIFAKIDQFQTIEEKTQKTSLAYLIVFLQGHKISFYSKLQFKKNNSDNTLQFSIGFENLEKIVVKSSNAMCVHQNLINMFCCKCIHLVEDGQTPKLLDYGYVQFDMQLWSLQGTRCTVQWKNPHHTSHKIVYFNEFIANALRDNMGMIIFDL